MKVLVRRSVVGTLLKIWLVLPALVIVACATGAGTAQSEDGSGRPVDPAQPYRDFLDRQKQFVLDELGPDGEPLVIHYSDNGRPANPAVVFVHGVPTSSWMFRKVIDELSESRLRLIAPDNIGYGASSKPDPNRENAGEFFSPAAQSLRIEALLDHLDVTSAVFVVHDVGGPILWELLERRPRMISGLVVLNTIGAPEGFAPPAALDDPLVQAIVEMVGVDDERTVADLVCGMVAEPEMLDTPEQLEGYLAGFREGSGSAYLAFLMNLDIVRDKLPSYRRAIASIDVPACVLWGSQDENLPASPGAAWFAETLGVDERDQYVIGDAKHLVAEEEPALIADLVRRTVDQAHDRDGP